MKIIIAGAGEVGSHLAKMLSHEGSDITVVDDNPDRLAHVTSIADVVPEEGSPSSISVLQNAGVEKADLFVAVYPSESQEINIVSSILAKKLGAKRVAARVRDEELLTFKNRSIFKEAGIDLIFYPEKIAADEITNQIKMGSASDSLDFTHGKIQIGTFRIEEDTPLLDMKLGEFTAQSPELTQQYRIIAISRDEKTIIPSFDTTFLYNDLVYTASRTDFLPQLMKVFGKNQQEINKVMIIGGGTISELVARNLSGQVNEIKIIEKNKDKCLRLSEKLGSQAQIVNGDGRNTDLLLEESIKDYDAFVALTDQDETNVLACIVAKKFGLTKTIAEVENIEYLKLAEDMGVDTVINKKLVTAGRIFKFTLSGRARFIKYISGTDAEVLEYTVAPDSAITKKTLKEIKFPSEAKIGGIIRGGEAFVAVGDTKLEPYDKVSVFALHKVVKEIDKLFK